MLNTLNDKTVSGFFVSLFLAAEQWMPSERATAMPPGRTFEKEVEAALMLSEEPAAFDALKKAWEQPVSQMSQFRGQVLTIMRAIDRAFYQIHPRVLTRVPTRGGRLTVPAWLQDAREMREVTGAYYETEGRRLIARGPLCRSSRQPVASNADSLADRFCALDVVATCLDQEGRKISITHQFIPVDAARGVTPSAKSGHETIVFIPVAEESHDISKNHIRRGDNLFVDFRAHASIDPAQCIVEALTQAGSADIALAPELVVSEEEADKIADGLLHSGCSHRLVISGSGATRAKMDDQPWNEARVFNGYGAELWRQRKVWPAGITRELALQYGLPDPADGQIFEDTASGHEITVVDADGLGRCLILICQDLQARPLADNLVRTYQPDWIFVPVMDAGVAIGRWAHRRSLELSTLSQARFLISSSLSLAELLKVTPPPACGLAVGPSSPAPPETGLVTDEERMVKEAHVGASKRPAFASLTWRSGDWSTTIVSAK